VAGNVVVVPSQRIVGPQRSRLDHNCAGSVTILVVLIEPTSRELRILRNLMQKNAIWEEVGHKYLVQFDDPTGKQLRIQPDELERMAGAGWIRSVRFPRSAQRLNRYELAEAGSAIEQLSRRKAPQREIEIIERLRPRRPA